MAKNTDISFEELTGDGTLPKEEGYDEWAIAKIKEALAYNRANPDKRYTHEQICKEFGLEDEV